MKMKKFWARGERPWRPLDPPVNTSLGAGPDFCSMGRPQICIFTDHVRCTREGNAFTGVFSVHRGGIGYLTK